MQEFFLHLERVCRCPVLLVASDFDGTLAPIVSRPDLVEAFRPSIDALRRLACMPQTHVAIISGRSLADLAHHVADIPEVRLVGGHGSELGAGCAMEIGPEQMALLGEAERQVRELAARTPGSMVESKLAGLAFHYRNVDEDLAAVSLHELSVMLAGWPDLLVRQGKKVVELSVVRADKGQALQWLRQKLNASAVVYVGDDVTDEDAFAVLGGLDVGIKVGEGATAAAYQVGDVAEASRLLALLAAERASFSAATRSQIGGHRLPQRGLCATGIR